MTSDELGEVEARIRGINPYAKLHRTERCSIPLPEVLGRNAFDLDRILEIEPEFLDGRAMTTIIITTITIIITIMVTTMAIITMAAA